MPSAKPTQAPAFDATKTWEVLDTELRKADGSGYQVFQDKSFPQWKRWVEGSAEFDAKGLRDVVNANAIHLDAVEGNLNQHKDVDNTRHAALAARVTSAEAAIEALSGGPFPG